MVHSITSWICDFCNNEYSTEEYALEHEVGCLINPKYKHCISCTLCYPGACEDFDKYREDKVRTKGFTGIRYCKKHISVFK